MMDDHLSIDGVSVAETKIKGSRFIGIAMPCPDDKAIKANTSDAESRWRDASHYCWAAITGGPERRERFSDAGEPSGTAGKPILSVIRGAGLTDTMIVVVRYFGGTLLGTGGLVRAYSEAAGAALEDAQRVMRRACCQYSFVLTYSDYSAFESKMGDIMACRPETSFSSDVHVVVSIPFARRDEFLRRLSDLTERRAVPIELPNVYV